ncbi:caspase family protein [Alkalispirochaeta alkalica]|uniref:caspase family protein n=1 Tax=Alkalispirochaeta alkalica TaxID=46356 RepID=UPI0003711B41|nr:caspase family protein [Alkalispirochaeta alkalica]
MKRIVAAFLMVCSALFAAHASDGARIALVIGNGDYRDLGRLTNPANDARDIATALRQVGFTVDLRIDADLETMEMAVVEFGRRLASNRGATGFFFFAGHGVESGGENYLIPARASIASESFLRTRSVATQTVLDEMNRSGSNLNVVVLDACRDNPFSWARSGSRGLAAIGFQPPGSIVAYATSAGSVAADGTGRNGTFTAELLQHLTVPGIDINEVFRRTGQGVRNATNGRQIPAVYNQFFDQVYLGGVPQVASVVTPPPPTRPGFQVARTVGSIRVTVATTGTVFLDGERIGDLRAGQSATLSDVETGSRRLEIRYENGETENSTVTVRDGATATARFSYMVRAEPEVYRVGDRGPAGGVVFYDKGNTSGGWRYLEAWTADEDRRHQWKTSQTSTPGTSTAVGSGYRNTYTAMAGSEHPAAQVAMNARHGGFNDWFLPSKDELNLMYQKREVIGGFASVDYWSSSESGSHGARYRGFGNGRQYRSNKRDSLRVRVVRAF